MTGPRLELPICYDCKASLPRSTLTSKLRPTANTDETMKNDRTLDSSCAIQHPPRLGLVTQLPDDKRVVVEREPDRLLSGHLPHESPARVP